MELKGMRFQNIIHSIEQGSIAEELGIEPGDILLSVNGEKIEDIIEYNYLTEDDYLEVEIQTRDGEIVVFEIEKDYDEVLGLEFSNPIIDSVKSCSNKCVFCFIDQLPPGMRETLYFKDDDSRLSFLQGNFITMTNMKDRDIDKMIRYRISPVNVSVHTTNPKLRVKMLKNRFAGDILNKMRRLHQAGITMNVQVVAVPEMNDKEELIRTVTDLEEFYPQVESIAVVPVGLTKFRKGLAKIRPFTKEEARETIALNRSLQEKYYRRWGTRFVFLSDEFYVMAGEELPKAEEYENFIQLENGVGLMRKFEGEVKALLSLGDLPRVSPKNLHLATGTSAYEFMKDIARMVGEAIPQIKIEVHRIVNRYFGETITVSGLITATDLLEQLEGIDLEDGLLLPRVMMKADETVFLDDYSVEEFEEKLGYPVIVCEVTGESFLNGILGVGE
ncbi:MAG: DUF512 domain-containing protein [Filifactor alocis]|nr:DUF512 domain-containing protein [Filifactor alocis]